MFYMQPTFEVLFTNKSYIPVKNVSIRYIVSIHVCSFHCSLVKTEATNQLSFLFSCSRQMIRWALLLSCSMTSRTESSSHGNARVRKSSYRMLEMWTTSCSGNERKRTDREQQKKDLKLGVELLKEIQSEKENLCLSYLLYIGLKPSWQPLWPAAGSNMTSCPLSVSCRRVWRWSRRDQAACHCTHGSTHWRAGRLSTHAQAPLTHPLASR